MLNALKMAINHINKPKEHLITRWGHEVSNFGHQGAIFVLKLKESLQCQSNLKKTDPWWPKWKFHIDRQKKWHQDFG